MTYARRESGGGFRWRRGLLGALAGAGVGLTAHLLDGAQ